MFQSFLYIQNPMLLKIDKSFPVLKHKLAYKGALKLPSNEQLSSMTPSKVQNMYMLSFDHLVLLDYCLAVRTSSVKKLISKYIGVLKGMGTADHSQVHEIRTSLESIKQCLIQQLEQLYRVLKRLEFENMEVELSDLFTGLDGLFELYRYAWQLDLLYSMGRIKNLCSKTTFQGFNQLYHTKADKYMTCIDQTVYSESKFILNQFSKQLYMVPSDWTWRLLETRKIDLSIISLSTAETNQANVSTAQIYNQALKLLASEQCNQTSSFQQCYRLLLYCQMQQNLSELVRYLKTILLNKDSGFLNSDYEIWLRIYECSLKMYCRSPQLREKQGVEIDQLVQNHEGDEEFMNFILNCQISTVSLSSLNFYYKNVSAHNKAKMRPRILQKILKTISESQFKETEDVFEFVQNEAISSDQQLIMQQYLHLYWQIIENRRKISQNEGVYEFEKGFEDLSVFLIKNNKYLRQFMNEKVLKVMYSKMLESPKDKNYRITLNSILNILMITCFEEEISIEFYESSDSQEQITVQQQKCGILLFMIVNIITANNQEQGLKFHENVYSVISELLSQQSYETLLQEEHDGITKLITELLIISGKECDFKLDTYYIQPNKKKISDVSLKLFLQLTNNLDDERKSIENYGKYPSLYDPLFVKSYLRVKGLKDRLIYENVLNLTTKISPELPFAETVALGTQFFTFFAPQALECDKLEIGEEDHGILDAISTEFPIECLKLIYKRTMVLCKDNGKELISKFAQLPAVWLKLFGEADSHALIEHYIEHPLSVAQMQPFETIRQFYFYVELTSCVFSKLNEKSQKGIKQVKIIYSNFAELFLQIWAIIYNLGFEAEISAIARLDDKNTQIFHQFSQSLPSQSSEEFDIKTLKGELLQITSQSHLKIPMIESIFFNRNWLFGSIVKFVTGIGKICMPQQCSKYLRILYNPLQLRNSQWSNRNLFVTIFEMIQLIQLTCQVQQNKLSLECELKSDPAHQKQWDEYCLQLIGKLNSELCEYEKTHSKQQIQISYQVLSINLKALIINVLIPHLIKALLGEGKNKCHSQSFEQRVDTLMNTFSQLCITVERVAAGEESHLMTFLEMVEGYGNQHSQASNLLMSNISRLMFKATETLFSFIFRGIRVRSYHLYRFIRAYSKVSGNNNTPFFNSVIAYYINSLFKQFVEEYDLSIGITKLCDQDLLNATTRSTESDGNHHNFTNFTRYYKRIPICVNQPLLNKQTCVGYRICTLSMFTNLFYRINYQSLPRGVSQVWKCKNQKLFYLKYLQQITPLLSGQIQFLERIDEKICDIIATDCYGNLGIIMKNESDLELLKELFQLLSITVASGGTVKSRIPDSVRIPVKQLTLQIQANPSLNEHLSKEFSNAEDLINCNYEDLIDIVINCYNVKLRRGVTSNMHLLNLKYIMATAPQKTLGRLCEVNCGRLNFGVPKKQLINTLKQLGASSTQRISVSIDKNCVELAHTIISNFISSYSLWRQDSGELQTNQLFFHLKILSIVFVNNPELVPYLFEAQTRKEGQLSSVYEIAIECASINLIVFSELYILFLKTNSCFVRLENDGNPSEHTVIPHNLSIQMSMQQSLLQKLSEMLSKPSPSTRQLQCVIISLRVILQILCHLSFQSQAHIDDVRFRVYNFHRISNPDYKQATDHVHKQFLHRLLHILQSSQPWQSSVSSQIFLLIGQIFNLLMSDRDREYIKIDLEYNCYESKPTWIQGNKQSAEYPKLRAQTNPRLLPFESLSIQSVSKLVTNAPLSINHEVIPCSVLEKLITAEDCRSDPLFAKIYEYSFKSMECDEDIYQLTQNQINSNSCTEGQRLIGSEESDIVEPISEKESRSNVQSQDGIRQQSDETRQSGGEVEGNSDRHQFRDKKDSIQLSDGIIESSDHIRESDEIGYLQVQSHSNNSTRSKDYVISIGCSDTSLQFMDVDTGTDQHLPQSSNELQPTKNLLQELYEQSCINPQAYKQLLSLLQNPCTPKQQLFTFLFYLDKIGTDPKTDRTQNYRIRDTDEELTYFISKQLQRRGITSLDGIYTDRNCSQRVMDFNQNLPSRISNTARTNKIQKLGMKLNVNECGLYRKMHKEFTRKQQCQLIVRQYVGQFGTHNVEMILNEILKLEEAVQDLRKLKKGQKCGQLIQISDRQNRLVRLLVCNMCLNQHYLVELLNLSLRALLDPQQQSYSALIIEKVLSSLVKERIGLHILFTAKFDPSHSSNIHIHLDSNKQGKYQTLLSVILSHHSLITQILETGKSAFLHQLQIYIQISQLKNPCSDLSVDNYPFYNLQQSQSIFSSDEAALYKIMNKIVDKKISLLDSESQQSTAVAEYFSIMTYVDPKVFELSYKYMARKFSERIRQITNKEKRILSNFKRKMADKGGNESDSESEPERDHSKQYEQELEKLYEKQYKYWSYRSMRSKDAKNTAQQDLKYFRNWLVSVGIVLLPKIKTMRLNYHMGGEIKKFEEEIDKMKVEYFYNYGNSTEYEKYYLQRQKIADKELDLELWKKNETGTIFNEEILPIVQQQSIELFESLEHASSFIHDFVEFFNPPLEPKKPKPTNPMNALLNQEEQGGNESDQKLVIYNLTANLYEIILASQLMTTSQEKFNYHSMSKLKTLKTLQSLRNLPGSRRRSSLVSNRNSHKLSIMPASNSVKPEHLLKRMGHSCSFFYAYLGEEPEVKEIFAKYSDSAHKLQVLWQKHPADQRKQMTIECRRQHIMEDSLPNINDAFILSDIKIKFAGEIGLDYGGVTRQWVTLFVKELTHPDFGLFELSANSTTIQPSKNSSLVPNHLVYFKKLGMFVGKAMRENWLLEINFTKSFLKHLLGATLYVEDLEDIDPDTAKSLSWILRSDIGQDDLGLNFTYQKELLHEKTTVELVPCGANIAVGQDNKKEYVKLLANRKMTEDIREQSKAFMAGLEAVIPYSTLKLFTHKEISLYLSGMPHINLAEMKEYAHYESFKPEDNEIVWFWEIMEEWEQETPAYLKEQELQLIPNFLFFLTGSYKVPFGGFKNHPIGINRMSNCKDYLPVAHTCFSVMDISNYTSKQKMNRQFKKAVKQGKGFSVS